MKKNYYFVGIGGIGMSALARHFHAIGCNVSGYDRTQTRLTNEIIADGIPITFEDDVNTIPETFRSKNDTLVVATPAIPANNAILSYFRNEGFEVVKRSVVLGHLTDAADAVCVAGTHGKTTTSTLAAHILRASHVGCSAFLGGISVNYDTNYWSNTESPFVVTEADEYDRSFLTLHPHVAVITAMDADHLDIYGTKAEMQKAFRQFASQIRSGGALLLKYGLPIDDEIVSEDAEFFTYARENKEADFHAFRVKRVGNKYNFSISSPLGDIEDLTLGLPGLHNVENAVAAVASAQLCGATDDEIRDALASFRGNRRRFEYHIDTEKCVLIDDYAHHPQEIATTLNSVRDIYGKRPLTVAFQPHLYTRTRDFADDFAKVLATADRLLMLDIYPARELPIEGVTTQMLIDKIKKIRSNIDVHLVAKEQLAQAIAEGNHELVLIMGAGNIDALVPEVEAKLKETL
ncbi:MAG: UDP-N-acetylmuramate--L-alanine ligase [Marinilabiliaceae bacterium]|nr:UDP-N-acetylmuramate--L-alanine ligase [Marinilabiliaceae bacterium]